MEIINTRNRSSSGLCFGAVCNWKSFNGPNRTPHPGIEELTQPPPDLPRYIGILRRGGGPSIVEYVKDGKYAVVGDKIIGLHDEIQRQTIKAISDIGKQLDTDVLELNAEERERINKLAPERLSIRPFGLLDLDDQNWPQRTIPYNMTLITSTNLRSSIQKAINHWNEPTSSNL